jgi:hypothetical protein
MAEERIASVATLKTEAMIAQEIKDALRPVAQSVAEIMEKAARHGMMPQYNITQNQFGKFVVSEITITKQIL